MLDSLVRFRLVRFGARKEGFESLKFLVLYFLYYNHINRIAISTYRSINAILLLVERAQSIGGDIQNLQDTYVLILTANFSVRGDIILVDIIR